MDTVLNSFANLNILYAEFYDTYFTNIGDEDPILYLIYNIPNTNNNNKIKIQLLNIFVTQSIPNTQEDKLYSIKKFFDDYNNNSKILMENEDTKSLISSFSKLLSRIPDNTQYSAENLILRTMDLIKEIKIPLLTEENTEENNLNDESLHVE